MCCLSSVFCLVVYVQCCVGACAICYGYECCFVVVIGTLVCVENSCNLSRCLFWGIY